MTPIFHIDLEKTLNSSSPLIVELGCGPTKHEGRIGIDRLDLPGVSIVADLEQGLPFFPDNSVDIIYSKSFLEHINNLEGLMHDIWRILKPTGRKKLFVPHFSNPYYYSDYTHTRFFGLYSFQYFSKYHSPYKRQVPTFYHDFSFQVESLSLVFRSPWRSRRIIKRMAQKLFNLNPWCQEFYEENLCYLIPCYGIQATLRPDK